MRRMKDDCHVSVSATLYLYSGLDTAEADGRPPPCIGICYYEKLKALEAREELTRHNEVLKEVKMKNK